MLSSEPSAHGSRLVMNVRFDKPRRTGDNPRRTDDLYHNPKYGSIRRIARGQTMTSGDSCRVAKRLEAVRLHFGQLAGGPAAVRGDGDPQVPHIARREGQDRGV